VGLRGGSSSSIFGSIPILQIDCQHIKSRDIDQGKKMSLTPEEQLRLSACIQEIAQILYKNTDSAEIATLEGLEKVVRQQMLEYVSPKIALFLSKK
jgi:hypothetical protein